MNEREFWSPNRRFGLRVSDSMMDKMIQECVNANGFETGGILMGYYTPEHDCAVVAELTGPPEDSTRSRTTFYRGVRGLQGWIGRLWREERHYYVGEWHYHPGGSPDPSPTDDTQMIEISQDKKARCPEPVLLLIGGDPHRRWEVGAYVYPRGRVCEVLLERKVGSCDILA